MEAAIYPRRKFLKQVSLSFGAFAFPFPFVKDSTIKIMKDNDEFDVIVVGGSYSGLAAGMALGRALKKVLIIDDGTPCNRQTPFSHNFLTNDGRSPTEIAALANLQVRRYETVKFFKGLAISGIKKDNGFEIQVASGESFATKKLIFATGIRDIMPDIDGFAACWGISVLHCPYCHGYEVKNEITGLLGNGESGYDFARLISNWTNDLTLFPNGSSTLTVKQSEKLAQNHIAIVEKKIERLEHINGHLKNIIFRDGTSSSINAIYTSTPFEQHCIIPESLGCELSDEGYLKIDSFLETTIKGVHACGDNVTRMRTVANAVAMGTTVGMTLSKKMILEEF